MTSFFLGGWGVGGGVEEEVEENNKIHPQFLRMVTSKNSTWEKY